VSVSLIRVFNVKNLLVMYRLLILISIVTFTLCGCTPIASPTSSQNNDQELFYQDYNYLNTIKTVRLYPFLGTRTDALQPAVVPLAQPNPLLLEFDDLREDVRNYYVKLIHCNADWTRSFLRDLDYMFEYNEFQLLNYEFSFNTRVPYVHYRFEVPKVKVPGNYLLLVYHDQNENDLVLSQRFVVFDERVIIKPEVGISAGIVERDMNQQIEFVIDYSQLYIQNPLADVKVVIRQNQRWDNAIFGLKPSLVREDQGTLIYREYNLENNFSGGNEFRFFDLRAVRFLGQNIDRVNVLDDSVVARLLVDRPRATESYSQIEDLNGQYLIENMENRNPALESEYVEVEFLLESGEPLGESVYINGELTNWNLRKDNRMQYDPVAGLYHDKLLLKQGWYNYSYTVKKGEEIDYSLVEGSHFETENEYEIIVYYRSAGTRYDEPIGYVHLVHNPRL